MLFRSKALQARMPLLQELKDYREKKGQTIELFPAETPQPEAEGLKYQTPEGKPIEPFPATAAEAAPVSTAQPKEVLKAQEVEGKVGTAQAELDAAVKEKDTDKLYAAIDNLNKAQDELSRAKSDIGRPTFKPAVIDIFDPSNLINEAFRRGDTQLISELARQLNPSMLQGALRDTGGIRRGAEQSPAAAERARLLNVLDSRLDAKGVKRERADLFSQLYGPDERAKFVNGNNLEVIKRPRTELVQEFQLDKKGKPVIGEDGKPVVVKQYEKKVLDKNGRPIVDTVRLQDVYDKGGPAAVEYERVMQDIEELSRKVTTKQGNAKESLYEQIGRAHV